MPYTHSRRLPRTRARHTISLKAPLTDSQRKERAARARKRRDEYTLNLATDLARRFNRKPRYFLDHFFQAGAHLVTKKGKVNPYNAFLAMKASELRLSKYSATHLNCADILFQPTYWKMGKPQPSQHSNLPNTQKSTKTLTKPSSTK